MVGAGNESCIEKILIKLKMNRVFMETFNMTRIIWKLDFLLENGENVHERMNFKGRNI